jgi:hypothetical protein
MTSTREFYLARADECAAEAAAAPLANVRERAQRSEAAWRGMAVRVERLEEQRALAEEARRIRTVAEG